MSTPKFNKMHFESKNFKKVMIFNDVDITPALAQDLLTLNDANRPVSNANIKKYTKAMQNNDWPFCGEIIQISREAKLINGQHRLLAIINSGTTHRYHIQAGLEPKIFNYVDILKVRSHGDTLATLGYTQYGIVAAVARYVTMYNNKLLYDYLSNVGGSCGAAYRFSNQEIADAADKLDKNILQSAARAGSKYYARNKFMDQTTVASLTYIFSMINEEDALNFMDMLSSGDGIGSEHYPSIHLLRNKLINSVSSGSKITIKHKWALFIKAWNVFRQKRALKILSWTENEEFPKPM